jgi:hypothetical protein
LSAALDVGVSDGVEGPQADAKSASASTSRFIEARSTRSSRTPSSAIDEASKIDGNA